MLQNGVATPLQDFATAPVNPTTGREGNLERLHGRAERVFRVLGAAGQHLTAPVGLQRDRTAAILRSLWNGTAAGASAGTLTGPDGTGFYTATLTGVTIPATAKMLTGGLGYSYSVANTLPLTQTNVPSYPVDRGLGRHRPDRRNAQRDRWPDRDCAERADAWRTASPAGARSSKTRSATSATRNSARSPKKPSTAGSATTARPALGATRRTAPAAAGRRIPRPSSTRSTPARSATCSSTGTPSRRREGFWDIGYPGVLKDCETCHIARHVRLQLRDVERGDAEPPVPHGRDRHAGGVDQPVALCGASACLRRGLRLQRAPPASRPRRPRRRW